MSTERGYYISSKAVKAVEMARLIRAHWDIENQLHWVLDVSWGEDASLIRDKVAAELKIDRAVLAPRHILAAVAAAGSYDVPAMREWQKRVLGDTMLAALKK